MKFIPAAGKSLYFFRWFSLPFLLERLMATLWISDYEKNRLFILAGPLLVLVTYCIAWAITYAYFYCKFQQFFKKISNKKKNFYACDWFEALHLWMVGFNKNNIFASSTSCHLIINITISTL